jgi:hypothetical protein
MSLWGIILIGFGIIYVIRPNIFRRGIWKSTAVTQQIFSPKQYTLYMRILGAIFIAIGIFLQFKYR